MFVATILPLSSPKPFTFIDKCPIVDQEIQVITGDTTNVSNSLL